MDQVEVNQAEPSWDELWPEHGPPHTAELTRQIHTYMSKHFQQRSLTVPSIYYLYRLSSEGQRRSNHQASSLQQWLEIKEKTSTCSTLDVSSSIFLSYVLHWNLYEHKHVFDPKLTKIQHFKTEWLNGDAMTNPWVTPVGKALKMSQW